MNIKTIDLIAKKWLDKPAANPYVSAQLTLNYGMKDEKTFYMPYELLYNEQITFEAVKLLVKENLIPAEYKERALWRLRDELKIIIRYTMHENCKKKDVKAFGVKESD